MLVYYPSLGQWLARLPVSAKTWVQYLSVASTHHYKYRRSNTQEINKFFFNSCVMCFCTHQIDFTNDLVQMGEEAHE